MTDSVKITGPEMIGMIIIGETETVNVSESEELVTNIVRGIGIVMSGTEIVIVTVKKIDTGIRRVNVIMIRDVIGTGVGAIGTVKGIANETKREKKYENPSPHNLHPISNHHPKRKRIASAIRNLVRSHRNQTLVGTALLFQIFHNH